MSRRMLEQRNPTEHVGLAAAAPARYRRGSGSRTPRKGDAAAEAGSDRGHSRSETVQIHLRPRRVRVVMANLALLRIAPAFLVGCGIGGGRAGRLRAVRNRHVDG